MFERLSKSSYSNIQFHQYQMYTDQTDNLRFWKSVESDGDLFSRTQK